MDAGVLQGEPQMDDSLVRLSAEVIGHLLSSSSHSHLVIPLWKCGDVRLNRKIASRVTNVDLKDRDWTSTSRYPKLLSSLHGLRSLSIDRGTSPLMIPFHAFNAELRKLPSTLTHLAITCFGAQNAFYNYDEASHNAVQTTYELGNSKLFHISSSFPSLSSLKISGGDHNTSLSACDFPGIPTSLTKLSLSYYDAIGTPMLHCLPRSLQVLEIGLAVLNPNITDGYRLDLANLPPNLLEISSLKENILMTDPVELEVLPKSLTKMKVDWRFLPWSLSLSEHLPPALKKMKILMMDLPTFAEANLHWAAQLPLQLTELSISTEVSLTAELAALLPKTLTSLYGSLTLDSTSFKVGPDSDDFDWRQRIDGLWPPRLSHLGLNLDFDSSEWENMLPRTLTSLKVTDPSRLPRKFSLERLTLLTSFVMGCIQRTCLVFVERNLPKSLTKLHVGVSPYLGALVARHIDFPPSLTDMNIKWADELNFEAPFNLPISLTRLFISSWHWEWLNKFPSTLRHLNVRFLVGRPDIPESRSFDLFKVLPSGLETLILAASLDFIGSLPSLSFSSLPSLTVLEVHKFITFDSPVLRKLSKRLRRLKLTLERILEQDAPFLPPNVTEMDLHHPTDPITESIIADHCSLRLDEDTVFRGPGAVAIFKRRLELVREQAHAYPDPRILID